MLGRDVDLTSGRLFHDKRKPNKNKYPAVQKLKAKINGFIDFVEFGSVINSSEKTPIQYVLAKLGYKVGVVYVAPYEEGKRCDCCGTIFTVVGDSKRHKQTDLCVNCFHNMEREYHTDRITNIIKSNKED